MIHGLINDSRKDQVTQQNASQVEESAAAAAVLESQAGNLTEAVSIFRIKPDTSTTIN